MKTRFDHSATLGQTFVPPYHHRHFGLRSTAFCSGHIPSICGVAMSSRGAARRRFDEYHCQTHTRTSGLTNRPIVQRRTGESWCSACEHKELDHFFGKSSSIYIAPNARTFVIRHHENDIVATLLEPIDAYHDGVLEASRTIPNTELRSEAVGNPHRLIHLPTGTFLSSGMRFVKSKQSWGLSTCKKCKRLFRLEAKKNIKV